MNRGELSVIIMVTNRDNNLYRIITAIRIQMR